MSGDVRRAAQSLDVIGTELYKLHERVDRVRELIEHAVSHEIPQLATSGGIAKHLGVRQGAIHNWETRDLDFPAPVMVLSGGTSNEIKVWVLVEVVEWYGAYTAHRGRS